MAQEFTREKLSAADAFGNPVYIGPDKTTIHTVPANSQDTITLYLKFGRTARCEVTLFRSDGTNDYELPIKYLGSSGSIVPVEITNVQAGNTIKAQLSGASPNTTLYVTSGEVSNAYFGTASTSANPYTTPGDYLSIYTDKFQTGTPRNLYVTDLSFGSYTAPTTFRYCPAAKYFPDTGHLVFVIASGTGAGVYSYDVYENRVVFYSASYQHANVRYGTAWVGDKLVFGYSGPYVIDFADRANPTLTSNSVPQWTGVGGSSSVVTSDGIIVTMSQDASFPHASFVVNANSTVSWISTSGSNQYNYAVFASGDFADGKTYIAWASNGGSGNSDIVSITTAGAMTSEASNVANTTYTENIVACPSRNEFWYFRGSSGSWQIRKYDTTTGTWADYTNSRELANHRFRAFYDSVNDVIWIGYSNGKWYGWDPNTGTWTRDSVLFTDYQWAGQNSQVHSLGVINNGTNNMLYGEFGSGNMTVLRNLDTGSEHYVSHGISTASNDYHAASGRIYSASTEYTTPYIHVTRTTGTPTTEQNYYPPSYGTFTSYLYGIQVDQVNDKLYYSDYYSSLFRAGINATNGQLSYEAEVINLSSTSYRLSQWVVDPVGQKWYVFSGQYMLAYDMSTGSTTPTQYTIADLGIGTGLPSYSSNFNYQQAFSGSAIYQGQCGPAYDQANNIAYLSCYYYTGSTYSSGVIKLDLSQVGVSTSSTYAGFASIVNNTSTVYISRHISNGKILAGTTTTTDQRLINVSDMSLSAVAPIYATSSTYGRLYDAATTSLYFSDASYKSEGQKYGAPAGEMPVDQDFYIYVRSGSTSDNQGLKSNTGSTDLLPANYSDSSSAQRTALDIEKGNSTTGHVNRATATA